MAIVKMNKFTLLTFGSHKEELLRKLQGTSKVQFINLQDDNILEQNEELKDLSKDSVDANNAKYEENLSKAKSALDFLTCYMPKKSGLKALEDDKENLTLAELEKIVESTGWNAIYDKVKEKERQLNSYESEITKLQGEIEILTPWQGLDCSFQDLEMLNKTAYFLGSIAKQYEEEMTKTLSNGYVEVISRSSNDINVLVIVDMDNKEETLSLLRNYGFSTFKTEHNDVPQKIIMDYTAKIEDIKSKIFFLKEEIASYEEDTRKMKLVCDYYENKVSRERASGNFLKTKNTVTIQGWCAVEDNNSFENICKDVAGNDYYLAFEDVKEEEIESVPIKLKNGVLAKAFESVTEMYSYPRYDEVDPTPLLTPFYLLFFGMMVADAGYGLLMLIVSLFAIKCLNMNQKNKDFATFFMFLSFPTIAFGLVYGSFFGDILPIKGLINPTKDVNTILVASIVFGVVQIFFGLGIKFYVLFSHGKKKDAIVDVGSWILILASIGVFAGQMMLGWPSVVKTISIVGIVVAALGIIYSGGRNEKTKGAQIGQGLYNLYNITGYIGDLVSYTRLMALGLSGGCIAGALNMLLQSVGGWLKFIVIPLGFVGAHIFNLLLSLLGAYVHTARLQYVEYFGKFYEGGGKPFAPFKASEKYMNLKEEN